MIYDVRNDQNGPIDEIVFSHTQDRRTDIPDIAYTLTQWEPDTRLVAIHDLEALVLVENAAHARNLIKALEKAIELKWLV